MWAARFDCLHGPQERERERRERGEIEGHDLTMGGHENCKHSAPKPEPQLLSAFGWPYAVKNQELDVRSFLFICLGTSGAIFVHGVIFRFVAWGIL